MMSIRSKREVLERVVRRYWAARGAEKRRILDEFVAITGYHRKYAIHVLRHPPEPRKVHRRQRKRIYGQPVQAALVRLWRIANCICGKRLVPYLPELIAALERHHELQLEPQVKSLLWRISPATADRLLHAERRQHPKIGLGTTKPGSLLKKGIPIRTFTAWDDERPGFLEVDLVAHCGATTQGQYLYSLVLTDVSTGWTECVALLNRGQRKSAMPLQPYVETCLSRSWVSILTTALSSSTTSYCATADRNTSPSPAHASTTRTTRRMWSRRTGLWCARSSATIAMKAHQPAAGWPPSTRSCAATSTSASHSSSSWLSNESAARSKSSMIPPLRLTNASRQHRPSHPMTRLDSLHSIPPSTRRPYCAPSSHCRTICGPLPW